MTLLRALFWNDDEARLRALWRLLLHGVALLLIGLMVALAATSLGLGGDDGLSAQTTMISALVVGLATWLCARVLDKRRFDDFGLRLSPRWWLDFGAGVGIGVALMAAIFVVELRAGWLTIEARNVGAAPGQSFWVALLDPLVAFVAVGFYEELFSRGYHLRNLAEGLYMPRLGRHAGAVALVLATLLSASVFGLAHAGNDNATLISSVNVGLAGCMLAAGLLWTGELALPIGLHLGWNFCQGNVFGFPVSGNPMPVRVVAIEQGGDPLITGGAFGPEAGLIGIAAMLLGVGLIALWVRLTHGELRLHTALAEPSEGPREAVV